LNRIGFVYNEPAKVRMPRLISAGAALIFGILSAMLVHFLHSGTIWSMVAGVVTAIVAFIAGALGLSKTVLDIAEKRLDIRRKTKEVAALDHRIVPPSSSQISQHGGERYREIERAARARGHDSLSPRSFVTRVDEQKSDE